MSNLRWDPKILAEDIQTQISKQYGHCESHPMPMTEVYATLSDLHKKIGVELVLVQGAVEGWYD